MTVNIEVEQAVLGTLLCNPKMAFIADMLRAEDFAPAEHQALFQAIAAGAAEGKLPSPESIGPQLGNMLVGTMTMRAYLGKLVTVATYPEMLLSHVRVLKEFAGRRTMLAMADHMRAIAQQPEAPILPFIGEAVPALDEIAAGMMRRSQSSFLSEQLAAETVARLKSGEKPNLIKTGLLDLDKMIGGWARGELTIIGGRPSMGKTTLALSALRQGARKGMTALFFSMEMSRRAVSDRLLSDAVWNRKTPVPYVDIIRGEVNDWNIQRLEDTQKDMVGMMLRVDDQPGLTATEIGVRARRFQDELNREGKRLDVICIDHLGFMRASDRYRGQRVHEVGEKTSALKELAKSLDVASIALCQLSRETERRDDKRPQLADLRDSGDIEQDADTVIFTYRDAYYTARAKYDDEKEEMERRARLELMENIIELIGAKTRNGPVFNQQFYADMGSNVVRDLV